MDLDMVRAWKDEAYRESLSEEERSLLLQNPVGELTDDDLQSVYGGGANTHLNTALLDGDQLCPNIQIPKKYKQASNKTHVHVKVHLDLDKLLKMANIQVNNLPNMSDFNS